MSMVDNMLVTGERPTNSDTAEAEPVSVHADESTVSRWPNDRILKLFGIDLPIIQAPMAGATTPALSAGVAQAGGLCSIAGAMLSLDGVRGQFDAVRAKTRKPINLNFFCHAESAGDSARASAWRRRLNAYYVELGLFSEMPTAALSIAPFGAAHCELIAELKPEIVSFHFGLPSANLVSRVKAAGSKILCSATSVKEAIWLEQRG